MFATTGPETTVLHSTASTSVAKTAGTTGVADRSSLDAGLSIPALAGLAAVVACVWFLALGTRHLLPADEGRYAEISREMVPAATG